MEGTGRRLFGGRFTGCSHGLSDGLHSCMTFVDEQIWGLYPEE